MEELSYGTVMIVVRSTEQGSPVKIRLDRDVLAEAVAWTARSLPTRPSVPILAGLLVKASGGQVVMSSFDYETSAQIGVPAQVTDDGVALVSGKLLADIARSLPNKPVDITADTSRMELVCGSARFTLQTLPVDDYPALPTMPEATGTVKSEDFSRAVAQVVVAAGRDELLPVFTGVRMEIEGDTLSLLATDRYRMALKEITWTPSGSGGDHHLRDGPGEVLALHRSGRLGHRRQRRVVVHRQRLQGEPGAAADQLHPGGVRGDVDRLVRQ